MNESASVHGPRGTTFDLKMADVRLESGLACYLLTLNFEWQLQTETPGLSVRGFHGVAHVHANGAFRQIGRLIPSAPTVIRLAANGQRLVRGSFALQVELSPAKMAALEDVRNGGDFLLHTNIDVEIHNADDGRSSIDVAQVRRTIEQSSWLKRLKEASFADTLLLEVPALDASDPNLAEATARFRESQSAAARGDWKVSVGQARDVLERLESAYGDKAQVDDAAFQKILEGSTTWSKTKRIQLLRRALKVFANPAKHDDDNAASFDWSRKDAVAVLQIQSAILRLLGP